MKHSKICTPLLWMVFEPCPIMVFMAMGGPHVQKRPHLVAMIFGKRVDVPCVPCACLLWPRFCMDTSGTCAWAEDRAITGLWYWCASGWWFGCHQFYFPMNLGFMSSSQLTDSYVSEGWRKPSTRLGQRTRFNCLQGPSHNPLNQVEAWCLWGGSTCLNMFLVVIGSLPTESSLASSSMSEWLVGGLEHQCISMLCCHILGISSSDLTNWYCSEAQPPTRL